MFVVKDNASCCCSTFLYHRKLTAKAKDKISLIVACQFIVMHYELQ
jgi:hypothetical protein